MPENCGGFLKAQQPTPGTQEDGGHGGAAT